MSIYRGLRHFPESYTASAANRISGRRVHRTSFIVNSNGLLALFVPVGHESWQPPAGSCKLQVTRDKRYRLYLEAGGS